MSDQQVTERVWQAAIDLVWKLWTTGEGIASWFGPKGFSVEVDVRRVLGGTRRREDDAGHLGLEEFAGALRRAARGMRVATTTRSLAMALLCTLPFPVSEALAEGGKRVRYPGSAVVRVADGEYLLPIECDDAGRPELGFSTEPSRITKKRTGRTSLISLRLRSSGQPDETIVSLDRYVAWIPQPTSSGGVLSLTLDLSPASMVRENRPVALTRDMWMSGDRPEGLAGAHFEARCDGRDPNAPSYRKIPRPDG